MSSQQAYCVTIVVAATATAVLSYWYHKRALQRMTEQRLAERKGRIRAEVKLRQALKTRNTQRTNESESSMSLRCIGRVVSPYTKRMGTPRQGALVPSSRGIIEFTIAPEALEGLQDYSHVWVIFEFHANTDTLQSLKNKVKPPRAPYKVGQLATRSPHRPNALGLSLVKVERLEKRNLYISALDLVNGTPVYDVKPCVPWDVPTGLKVPYWVSQEDALVRVEFTKEASEALERYVQKGVVSSLYSDAQLAQQAIQEILAQDPRSGIKRGTQDSTPYNCMFGNVQVQFIVNDGVTVVGVHPVEFDETAMVDGIPLVSGLEE